MVTVLLSPVIQGLNASQRSHKEADGYYFVDGILQVTKGTEIIASYPQVGVIGVEKTGCCCKD